MKKIFYTLFFVLLFHAPVFAADWDDATKAEMREQFVQSNDFVKENVVAKSIENFPPGLMKYFADAYSVPEEQVAKQFREILEAGINLIKTLDVEFDPEKIVYRQAPNGELFALLPYKSHIVTIEDEKINDDSVSFAFKTNGRWYFVDLENSVNIDAIKSIYPQFKDVDFTISAKD